jgi:uncharacterized membrane protein
MTFVLAFLIGFFAGLRSLTAPATTAWAVQFGRLRLERPLSLIGSTASVAVLTVFAVAELVVDKLPKTASRTAPLGLIVRILTGGLTGACVAVSAGQGAIPGSALGAFGGLAGCFIGYQARTRLVKLLDTRDIFIAVLEDLVAIGGSLWVVSRC